MTYITPRMRPNVYAFVLGFILMLAMGGTGFLGVAPWSPPAIITNIATNWAIPEPIVADYEQEFKHKQAIATPTL
jgi:hypothetical protein